MNLEQLGWKEAFGEKDQTTIVARVISEQRQIYKLHDGENELTGEVSGKFQFQATVKSDYPSVGDWVVIEPLKEENKAIIQKVLPRIIHLSITFLDLSFGVVVVGVAVVEDDDEEVDSDDESINT